MGGAHPHHFLKKPETDNKEVQASFLEDIMAKFKDLNDATHQLASEVKLVTAIFQWTPGNKIPYLQLSARPQTKNENSPYNDDATQGL